MKGGPGVSRKSTGRSVFLRSPLGRAAAWCTSLTALACEMDSNCPGFRAGKREPELGFLHGSLPSDLDFLPASEVLLSTKLGSLLVQTRFFSYVGFRSNGSVLRQLYFNFELANILSFFSMQQLL